MNKEFAWKKNSFSQANTASGVPRLLEKDMVRESISKMKNGKIAVPSGVVSDMVKAGEAGEAGVDMIMDQVNKIIVKEVIPAE